MDFFEKRKKDLEQLKQEIKNAIAIKKSVVDEMNKELDELENEKTKIEGRIDENILLNKSFSASKKVDKLSSGIIEGADMKQLIAIAKQKQQEKVATKKPKKNKKGGK